MVRSFLSFTFALATGTLVLLARGQRRPLQSWSDSDRRGPNRNSIAMRTVSGSGRPTGA